MVAIGPLGQEGLPGALWAPSHAPELEALSLPSREAEASVMLMMSGWWSPSSRRRSTVFWFQSNPATVCGKTADTKHKVSTDEACGEFFSAGEILINYWFWRIGWF